MQLERDPRLLPVSHDPFNAETPLSDMVGVITPNDLHYVREHFAVPDRWEGLEVDGLVQQPLSLALVDLVRMPSRSVVVTLECAGNGRGFLEPPAPGEQWRLGAVGTAEWTGVPLRHVLERARPDPRAIEYIFAGADGGTPKGLDRRISFERSLPVARAMAGEVLLAYAMNGEPVPPDHGAPLRLVVPAAYGMDSVKRLRRITAVDRSFRGFFQADRYVVDGRPLGPIAPRSVVTAPREGEAVTSPVAIRGYCWSGGAPVARVELSVDGGRTWTDADIEDALSPYAWRRWQHVWATTRRGDAVLLARAVTTDGRSQPIEDVRTDLGYGNNAAQPVRIRLTA